jgi:nucleotide-binding universal stress UspA family protein
MKTMRCIIAATDFSDEAQYAAERAAIVAKEQHATLNLLHVISDSALQDLRRSFEVLGEVETKLIDDARGMLQDIAASIGQKTGMEARADLRTGQVLAEILAASESADLLVLGAHGATPLRDLMLGTTTERLLRTCKRPMLVAKRLPHATYGQVIVGVDFSPYSAPALNMARRIAPGARITIVHAFRVQFEARLRIAGAADDTIHRYCEAQRQDAVKRIRDLIRESKDDAYRISVAVEHGDPSRVILAKEEELSADLIVIGKHGQSMIEALFLGSVTRHVLTGSKCDVLVVHEREPG